MKRLLLVVDEALTDAEPLPADVRERLEQFDEIRVVADALQAYPADQIVLVHHSEGFERCKEHDQLRRIRAHYAGPVDSLELDRAGRVVAHS